MIRMKVFGHRGFSGEYPENTMLAFQKAVGGWLRGDRALDVQADQGSGSGDHAR